MALVVNSLMERQYRECDNQSRVTLECDMAFSQSEHRNLVTLSKQITSINLVYFDTLIFFYFKFVQRYDKYKTNLEGGTLSSINPCIRLGISLREALQALSSG